MTINDTVTTSALSRRSLLFATAGLALSAEILPGMAKADGSTLAQDVPPVLAGAKIAPFQVKVPQAALNDLRARIGATRWPDRETVSDRSQGAQLDKMQDLARYWATRYDWRKAEARLNAFPQFLTNIDGVDIHFIHVRSAHAEALPLIITHGWPGSIFEFLNVIDRLANPTAHGGRAQDAFHIVVPSIPGFGFSGKPTQTGWNPARIAGAWDVLMKRLGYDRYVAQGGDWGAIISDALGRQAPQGLLGIHVNRVERATTFPPEVSRALRSGDPAPDDLTPEQKAVFNEARDFLNNGFGYAAIMGSRPQTIGYGLTDSPIGLAAWAYDKFADWVFTRGDPEAAFSRDEMLDNITLYWLTNTAASSGRIYWETNAAPKAAKPITFPAAISVFPGEVYRPPEEWARRAYANLVYYNKLDRGGHFAALEQPQLFAQEVRAAFRLMR